MNDDDDDDEDDDVFCHPITRSRICTMSTRLISQNYKLRGEETLNFVQIVRTLNSEQKN